MSTNNPCQNCIGKRGTGEECCIDVFIILNSDEFHFFEKYPGFYEIKEEKGGIFYTNEGCPYLEEEYQCSIQETKPWYCKYYPIFITGEPYVDAKCPVHKSKEYELTPKIERQLQKLKKRYPIYKKEWVWDEIKGILRL